MSRRSLRHLQRSTFKLQPAISRLFPLVAIIALLVGCRVPGTIPQDDRLAAVTATPLPAPYPRVRLPQDEGPHQNLTEWWYYTGHLDAADGTAGTFGFELVVFQVLRGTLPAIYLSHFAITDISGGRFQYAERSEQRPTIQRSSGAGFALQVGDWSMSGSNGNDRLRAAMEGYAIDLSLTAVKPPALHLGTGLIHYGAPGFSYYYSRTRMQVAGTLLDRGVTRPVTGEAWMDHQWGDFVTVLGGGWDWYSFQLEDGTDYMFYEIRDQRTGQVAGRFGTRIDPDGSAVEIPERQFQLETTDRWTSPHSGAVYPARWTFEVPEDGLRLDVVPVLADQELRTGQTTGLTYWEGAVQLTGERAGQKVRGRGYVELTGYAPKN